MLRGFSSLSGSRLSLESALSSLTKNSAATVVPRRAKTTKAALTGPESKSTVAKERVLVMLLTCAHRTRGSTALDTLTPENGA